jgi:hypothetical protein
MIESASHSNNADQFEAAQDRFKAAIARAEARADRAMVPPTPPLPPLPALPAAPAVAAQAAPQVATQVAGAGPLTDSLRALLSRAREDSRAHDLPPTTDFLAGPRAVASGTTVTGNAGAVGGPLDVYGTVNGDAVAIGGDVNVHPGAHVHGNVTALGGTINNSGTIDGDARSGTGHIGPAIHFAAGKVARRHSPLGMFTSALLACCVAMILGIAVLTFGSAPLDQTTTVLSEQFGRAFRFGIIGWLAVAPLAVVLALGLVLTLIGIILVPIALPIYAVAVLTAALLGFFAVAETTGYALNRQAADNPLTERGAKLRAMVTGVAFYSGLWALAALFSQVHVLGTMLRVFATAITVVALTVGFGAVIIALSRPYIRVKVKGSPATPTPAAAAASPSPSPSGGNDALWQTPTPVGGMIAARRPTPPPPPATPIS